MRRHILSRPTRRPRRCVASSAWNPAAALPFAVNTLWMIAGGVPDRPDPSIRRTRAGVFGVTRRSQRESPDHGGNTVYRAPRPQFTTKTNIQGGQAGLPKGQGRTTLLEVLSARPGASRSRVELPVPLAPA